MTCSHLFRQCVRSRRMYCRVVTPHQRPPLTRFASWLEAHLHPITLPDFFIVPSIILRGLPSVQLYLTNEERIPTHSKSRPVSPISSPFQLLRGWLQVDFIREIL